MKFCDMPYERIDVRAATEALDAAAERLSAAKTLGEAEEAFSEREKIISHVQTMSTIAYIRHTVNTLDGFYEKENDFNDENAPLIEQSEQKFTEAMLGSPLRAQLEEKYGISAEVIDSRSIVPFDYAPVIESVKKTGKIVIVGDACERNSVMRDMASNIAELAFDYLDAPPVVVGSRNWITPAYELEKYFFPQPDTIIDAITQKILPIPGRTPYYNFTEAEKIERAKKGV